MLTDKQKLAIIRQKANNALYFADSSDYTSALWEILEVTMPGIFAGGPEPKLVYIDDPTESQEGAVSCEEYLLIQQKPDERSRDAMCIFHRWAKWEQYDERGMSYSILSQQPRPYSERRQRRKCKKCGKEQDQPVSMY